MLQAHTRYRKMRNQTGSQIAEFGAALVFLATTVFVPLVDLSIIPIRWTMAQEIADHYARKLALCESFSDSLRMMETEPSLRTTLSKIGGVSVESTDLHLRIQGNSRLCGDVCRVDGPGQIPAERLPDGAGAPYVYSLELTVSLTVSPAVLVRCPGVVVPGLTAPFPIVIKAMHEWENLGRNPETGEFFLNE